MCIVMCNRFLIKNLPLIPCLFHLWNKVTWRQIHCHFSNVFWVFTSGPLKWLVGFFLLNSPPPCLKPLGMLLSSRLVTSLGYQEVRRVFWEGPKYFEQCPTHFSKSGKNLFRPLVTGLLNSRHHCWSQQHTHGSAHRLNSCAGRVQLEEQQKIDISSVLPCSCTHFVSIMK